LNGQIEKKPFVESELQEAEKNAKEKEDAIKILDGTIADARRIETLTVSLASRAGEKEREAEQHTRQAQEKTDARRALQEEYESARLLSEHVTHAEAAVKTLAAARTELDELAPHEAGFKAMEEKHSSFKEVIRTAQKSLDEVSKTRTSHNTMIIREDEIITAQRNMETVRNSRAGLEERSNIFNTAKKNAEAAVGDVKAFLAESRQRIGEINVRLDVVNKKAALLQDSECPIVETATCAFLKDAQAAKGELAELETLLKETQDKDRETYESLSVLQKTAEEALAVLTDPKSEAEALSKLEREAASVAWLAPKLEAAKAMLAELDKQEAVYKNAITNAQTEIESKVIPSLKEFEIKIVRADELRAVIKVNEPTATLLSSGKAAAATMDALNTRIKEHDEVIRQANDAAQAAINAAQELKKELADSNAPDTAALINRKSILEAEKSSLEQQTGGLKGKLEAIGEAKTQYDAYAAETATAAKALTDYQTLAQAFGIDGIQYMIIRSIVPEITSRANDILSAMTGGRMAVDLRTEREQKNGSKIVNSLDVWINHANGGSRPYSSHSGGEKVKTALAVTLALADIKARRAGAQLGMLFIDEPPFLDADGTEAYADALGNIAARNPTMRILAISHDPTMKARFPQNITVREGESGSEVVRD
jgi:exonuclease SbcC